MRIFQYYTGKFQKTQVRIRDRAKFLIILSEVIEMNVKEAVVARFNDILRQRGMRPNGGACGRYAVQRVLDVRPEAEGGVRQPGEEAV